MKNIPVLRAILMAWALAVSPLATADQTADTTLDLSEYRGKVVVLDFWASWCVPCRRSFPWLNSMSEKYSGDGLVIVGVNLDRERASAAEFLDEFPARFRIAYDTDAKLATQYGVQAMPSSFVIGRNGEIEAQHLGFKVKRQDEYEAVIVAALEQEMNE